MHLLKSVLRQLINFIPALLFFGMAYAENGVTDTNIKIGMSVPLSGMNAAYGAEIKETVDDYFMQVNSSGGINGRTLTLVALDDGYEADRSAQNTIQLVQNNKVFALTSYYGTATTTASLPMVTAAKIPLIGTFSGANSLRIPLNRYMFNVRASYAEETNALIKQMLSIGLTRIGVLYQNDGFGKSGLDGITAALKVHHLQPTVVATVEHNSTDVDAAVATFTREQPQAIIMVTLLKATTAFVRKFKASQAPSYLATLSPIGAQLLANDLGEMSRGIMISQVIPFPWNDTLPLARDYKKLVQRSNGANTLSYTGMEAYANARIMVEAIRLCGKNLTREKLIEILENMHDTTIGGFPISYSSTNRSASKFVEITILGANGKILR